MKKMIFKASVFISLCLVLCLLNYKGQYLMVSATETLGTLENPHLIDDESDFSLMNGSDAYFKMTKNITISDSVTSLGIETFSGVLEGNGYSIFNLNGSLVETLTGDINNLVIDNPREFVASMDVDTKQLSMAGTRYAHLVVTDNVNSSTSINGKPQYFGYVCSKLSKGNLNNVRVTNATINTNSHTQSSLDVNNYTAAYIGFMVGEATYSGLYNCTVDNSKMIYSTCYGVGGMVGTATATTIAGSLVRNLTINGKDDVAINQMPKAFTGLFVGINRTGVFFNNIAMDINQGETPHLSMVGLISCKNSGLDYTRYYDIYYDETVAPFSTNFYDTDEEELVYNRDAINPLEIQNASCDSYGSIFDSDNNNLEYHHGIVIKRINEFDSSITSDNIMVAFNGIITAGGKVLKRSETSYLPVGYVAEADKKIKINVSWDEVIYGDKLMDKVQFAIDEDNTNFDTTLRLEYKPEGWSSFVIATENTIITSMSFEWQIRYSHNGTSYVDTTNAGTIDVSPYDLNNAVIEYKESIKYSGYEEKVMVVAKTKDTNQSLNVNLVGTTSAKEVGTYYFTVEGKENATGSVEKSWAIIPGDMRNIYFNNTQAIYNGKSQNATSNGILDGSTIMYSLDDEIYSPSLKLVDAGEYLVYYIVSHPNYNDYQGTYTFTIKPREIEVTWLSDELVYNGTKQRPEFTIDNIVEGDTVEVLVIGEEKDVNVDETLGYRAQITAVDNPNYCLPSSRPAVNYRITYKLIEIPSFLNSVIESVVYNNEIQKVSIVDREDYLISENTGWKDVGKYPVKVNLKDTRNYRWEDNTKGSIEYFFEITPAENRWIVEPSIEGWSYLETSNAVNYEALYGTATILYNLKGDPNSQTSVVPEEAGEYEVNIEIKGDNYSNVLSKTLNLTIQKAMPDYELPNEITAEYGQILRDLTLSEVSGGTWEFVDELTTSVGNAGQNHIDIKFVPNNKNYQEVLAQVLVTVSKTTLTYEAPTKIENLIYNKEPQTLINPGIIDVDGLVMEYKVNDGDWSVSLPKEVDAKEYTISYRILGGTNYFDVSGSITSAISKKTINVTDIQISPMHFNENGYAFEISKISFTDNKVNDDDYEVLNISLLGENKAGENQIQVEIEIVNQNYLIENISFQIIGFIYDHLDEDKNHSCDSDDCTANIGEHSDGLDENHLCDYGCGKIADDGCRDNDSDNLCDECGEKLQEESSTGLVIAIISGVVALLGGLFSLYWFVLRKKK